MKLFGNLKKIKEIKLEKNMIIKLVLLAIISIVIAVVFEFYGYDYIFRTWKDSIYTRINSNFNTNYVINHSVIRVIIFILFNMFISLHFIVKPKKIYLFICDNRYKLALGFLAIVTILGLNGSSMSRVGYYYIEPENETHEIYEILGIDRLLRSDEFGSQSMYIASQQYNNYGAKSDLIGGDGTDMFTVYNSPIKSPLMLGRPFQIMFLILSFDSAFAFYWFSRVTLLFLASYELTRILTNNNKLLSLFGSAILTLSPAVQWWYCLEPLIWGETILVLFDLFFRKDNKIIKGLIAFALACSCTAYIFILYPAWQLAFGYIYIPVFVLILINLFKDKRLKVDVLDVTYICLAIFMIIALVCLWYVNSYDAIKATTQTVYPGQRISTGGDDISLFGYFYNMYMPYEAFAKGGNKTNNEYFDFGIGGFDNKCENATMLSLYPLPFILACIYLIKYRKKDAFLIISLVIGLMLSVYAIIGFPEILSRLTMLSISPGKRASVALATLCVYVLLYLLGKQEEEEKPIIKHRFIGVIISIILLLICLVQDGNNYLKIWEIVLSSVLFVAMFNFACNMDKKICRILLMILMSIVVFISGIIVNPIQKGLHYLEDEELAVAVREVAKEDPDALWVSSDTSFIMANFLAANGVKVLNATNAYPHRDFYISLFGEDNEEAEEIWNRYHHLFCMIRDDVETYLALKQWDYAILGLNYKDINKVGVKYIFTTANYEQDVPKLNIELVKTVKDYKIYRVLEQDEIGHMKEEVGEYLEARPYAVWYADSDDLTLDEINKVVVDNGITPVYGTMEEDVTNEVLDAYDIRYILTRTNLAIERPDLKLVERDIIGSLIVYEYVGDSKEVN